MGVSPNIHFFEMVLWWIAVLKTLFRGCFFGSNHGRYSNFIEDLKSSSMELHLLLPSICLKDTFCFKANIS